MDYNIFIETALGIDVELLQSLFSRGLFMKSLCSNSHFYYDIPLPLHYITICWDIVFKHIDEFEEQYRHYMKKQKKKNDEMKSFFANSCGVDMEIIDFDKYRKHFYILDFEEDNEDESDSDLDKKFLEIPDELYDAILGLPHERDLQKEVDALIEFAAYLKSFERVKK